SRDMYPSLFESKLLNVNGAAQRFSRAFRSRPEADAAVGGSLAAIAAAGSATAALKINDETILDRIHFLHPARRPARLPTIGLGSDGGIDCRGADWPTKRCEASSHRWVASGVPEEKTTENQSHHRGKSQVTGCGVVANYRRNAGALALSCEEVSAKPCRILPT